MSEYKPDYDPVIDADISILSVAFNDYDAYCESTEASAVFNWLYDYALNADKRIEEYETKWQQCEIDQAGAEAELFAFQISAAERNLLLENRIAELEAELEKEKNTYRRPQWYQDLTADPVGECNLCHRKTWAESQIGDMCYFPMPSKESCHGIFKRINNPTHIGCAEGCTHGDQR